MGPHGAMDDRDQVTRFNGQNDFVFWVSKVTLCLKSKGMWPIVEGTKKRPTVKCEGQTEQAFEDSIVNWQLEDDRAMSTIVMKLDNKPHSMVMRLKSSKAVWDMLLKRFQKNDYIAQFKIWNSLIRG